MTIEEKKALEALHIMEITPDHTISRLELKESFLSLSEKYMDNSEKYNKMKNAYDYLYDHMELLNEAIHNRLNPCHERHEYSYSWEEKKVEEVQGEVVEDNPKNEATFNPNELPKVKDRPTVFAAVLSLVSPLIGIIMFILTRRITPKSSFLYLFLAIVGLIASYFLMFFFFMR
ncbi:MAG: DUF308 domain-containing protein [Acholeplasmatales bacterium]|nr:DUF308 domain-containing protein [Acholeplasmatales bacterium]